MKLAFDNEAHYVDYSDGYELYINRARSGKCVGKKLYGRIIRLYCIALAKRLKEYGMVDLPADIGIISTAIIERRPQYRGKKFIGYGKMNWDTGHYDGTFNTFGLVFIPKLHRTNNLRCYGFVANRNLFKELKKIYNDRYCEWKPMRFNDKLI